MQSASILALFSAALALAIPTHVPMTNQTAVTMPLPPISPILSIATMTMMTSSCPSCPVVYAAPTTPCITTAEQTIYTTTTTTMIIKSCPSCPATAVTMETTMAQVKPTSAVAVVVNNATAPIMMATGTGGFARPTASASYMPPSDMPIMGGSSSLTTPMVAVFAAAVVALVIM